MDRERLGKTLAPPAWERHAALSAWVLKLCDPVERETEGSTDRSRDADVVYRDLPPALIQSSKRMRHSRAQGLKGSRAQGLKGSRIDTNERGRGIDGRAICPS
jgi:hypothetical protein